MAGETKAFFEKFKADMAKMKQSIPSVVEGFSAMFGQIMNDGTLSVLEKELIALGIAVAKPCTPCIRAHVQKSLAAGASRQQILEAASVAVVMGGGPAYTHIPVVIDTLDELADK